MTDAEPPPHHPEGSPDPAPFRRHDVLRSDRVYDSKWCALDRHQIRLDPDATAGEADAPANLGEYHVFRVPDAIVVVPVTHSGDLVMIWQHRHPHGRTHWEVPAGRINAGEPPIDAAARELEEETGFRAEELVDLGGFYPVNGISDHFAHVFLARGCEPVGAPELEDAERLLVRTRPLDEVRTQLKRGAFKDGFTALALFYGLGHMGKLG